LSAIAEFVGTAETRSLDAGEVVFSQGAASDGRMYVLLDGSVEIVRGNSVLEHVPEGGVFGELALIDDLPRTATAQAREASRLAVISGERFRELILRNPSFAVEIMRLLARRVRRNLQT